MIQCYWPKATNDSVLFQQLTVLGSWRSPIKDHVHISKSVYYSTILGLTILHKGKMVMTLRGVHRLLLSTAKGNGLWQLAYLRCGLV